VLHVYPIPLTQLKKKNNRKRGEVERSNRESYERKKKKVLRGKGRFFRKSPGKRLYW